ncbi:hypothetical protein K488DRAFT_79284 [Vararia minispora EC-137]|uniref:Uncharacterized protein n=1 Tax=Vararia minispora EC-137 TaxID=1314806 RepID=A0ACB8QHB9_9AGAM|nr:hypothetical protein K488DRAFT_79284 [Vararia minispora EC-137]
MPTVLPGEIIPAKHVNLKLGPGLQQEIGGDNLTSVVTTLAGYLQRSANGARWWVENSSAKRYVPAPQEPVIGTVVLRLGESYKVDIGAGQSALLDGLAFEGASRRNRPNLKIGSLVYARVSLAHKDMDPEIECFDAQTRKAEGFGELKGGFVTICSLRMSRNLLDPNYFLLPLLGSRFPLDAAVGVNGRVWVSCKEVKQTVTVVRCIEAADSEGGGKGIDGIKQLLNTLDL